MVVSLETSVAGVPLERFAFNASGPICSTLNELREIGISGSSVITTKSCTLHARSGNPEPRWAELPLGGLQAMGLPNEGYEYYLSAVPALKVNCAKPVCVSVSGLTLDANKRMVDAFQYSETPPDLLEINLSCPNIAGKPQVGYDVQQTRETLRIISEIGGPVPLGLKLPPYFDMSHFDAMADVIRDYSSVRFLTTVNSVGNALVVDYETETPVIKPKGGFGGLSGSYIKPIGLANTRAFYERLGSRVDIVGVGGVTSGKDAFEYLLVGASAVQIGSPLMTEGLGCFDRVHGEISDILQRKGDADVTSVKGRLHIL
ncbi:MAG: uncharacterized protein KVP18_004138 [Porospora cf. gigantea A]|uniref:uncharacterized protein n=1 Tax=Porospora cf. gigantea A TaxID=2853593 RepID=UPI00355A8638|nr:MAG: hypothetical protein KVP18_004138 [Porospora cf. gigantea A]